MKRIFKVSILLFSLALLFSCNNDAKKKIEIKDIVSTSNSTVVLSTKENIFRAILSEDTKKEVTWTLSNNEFVTLNSHIKCNTHKK